MSENPVQGMLDIYEMCFIEWDEVSWEKIQLTR